MDQLPREADIRDAVGKVKDAVGEVIAQAGAGVQGKLDQGKAMVQDALASAEEAIGKTTDLARKASKIGGDFVARADEAVDGAARKVGNQAGQAASAAYEQSARAGEYVSRYMAERPLTALLVAGAIGYGLAYLIHRR